MAVTETVSFRLRNGIDASQFAVVNSRVESDHISIQPGYIPGSRVTTVSDDGVWTVRLRWNSAADADASMASFAQAPAAAEFMAMMAEDTMTMAREMEVANPANPRAANVHALYMEGIRDGNAREAVEAYTGDRYTQHSTGVRDGVEGFVEFFEGFVKRNPKRDIEIVRTISDGSYVFVHAVQYLNDGESKWTTMDLFDFDGNNRLVEHWDTIAAVAPPNASGHTQIDGSTEISDVELTESNKQVVRRLLAEAFAKEPSAPVAEFISAEKYIQHNPMVGDGLAALEAMIEEGQRTGRKLHYKKVHRLLGQGNFVVALSHQVLGEVDYAAFDIFRLEDGLIVEHWDNVEPLPIGDQLVNSGKF